MLNSTGVTLGLLEAVDMLLFFERRIRGGISGVAELRHFTANNPHLNTFEQSQKTTFGAFYDVTSLYAGTMQKMMPQRNYRWNSETTVNQILETPESSDLWYFVEVDLKYPQHLHDLHNVLPLAPEKRTIRSSWLSPFAQSFGIKPNKTPKLIETLLDKKNYVCHYENLKFHINQGLIVKKLHRVCEFQQMLGVYIEKNTVIRKQATKDFEKNYYKLMSNVCSGKTMENLRKRSKLKLCQIINKPKRSLRAQRSNHSKLYDRIWSACRSKIRPWYGLNQPPCVLLLSICQNYHSTSSIMRKWYLVIRPVN